MRRIRVGISGLGRAGWNIHVRTLSKLREMYEIVAVCDPIEDRLREAEDKLKCRVYSNYDAFVRDEEIDLVIIASPTHLHEEQTFKAFEQGKNVVCEKPMAMSSEVAKELLILSERKGIVYSIFHNRRYDPDYLEVSRILNSGRIGKPLLIKSRYHMFSRRWDWQSLKKFGGGELRNTGSHFLDQLLLFYKTEEPEIEFCHLARAISLGDAEDHVKILLKDLEGLVCDLEISRACAYPEKRWHVIATHGGLEGTEDMIEWKWIDEDELPKLRLNEGAVPDRTYNVENINWHKGLWKRQNNVPTTFESYYMDFYRSYIKGEDPPVKPESSLRVLKFIELCEKISKITS